MADGVRLRYSVLLPPGHKRVPVVLTYSGYDSGGIGGVAYQHDQTAFWLPLDASLLNAGYAVMGVNLRGTGCSEGNFDLFSPQWGQDGAQVVEWAAGQPWSDGNVGMANWSFGGLTQLFVAANRPPHLRAIAPGMVVTDPWRDVGYPGGVANAEFPAAWWAYVQEQWANAASDASADGDASCLATVAAHEAIAQLTSPPLALAQHPYVDAYAEARELRRVTHRIDIPVLSMEDWQDQSTGTRGGYYQESLDPAKTWYVGTNGSHDIYVSAAFHQLLLPFLDRYLRNANNGFDRLPHVQLWQDTTSPGAPRPSDAQLESAAPGWVIKLPRLPVAVNPVALYLGSKNDLGLSPGSGLPATDGYSYPVPGPTVNDDLVSAETGWQHVAPVSAGSLAYTTTPLAQDVTVMGPASADLWLSSTATDLDLQVTLTEVRPDGQEQYLQRGWLRASARAIEPALSSVLRPFHPQTREAVMQLVPGTPALARVEINKLAHTFRRGSSIRMWIDAPSITGDWGFALVSQPASNQIWHDQAHQSRLVLGILSTEAAPRVAPACEALVFEPCRVNPRQVPAGPPLVVPPGPLVGASWAAAVGATNGPISRSPDTSATVGATTATMSSLPNTSAASKMPGALFAISLLAASLTSGMWRFLKCRSVRFGARGWGRRD